jgi:hypothetical protein
MTKPRDYKKEYATYHGKPAQIAARSSRNKAVRKLGREGAGDGKDVDHKDGNPKNNKRSNLRVISKSTNRSKK